MTACGDYTILPVPQLFNIVLRGVKVIFKLDPGFMLLPGRSIVWFLLIFCFLDVLIVYDYPHASLELVKISALLTPCLVKIVEVEALIG